jgi:hypothetical protein
MECGSTAGGTRWTRCVRLVATSMSRLPLSRRPAGVRPAGLSRRTEKHRGGLEDLVGLPELLDLTAQPRELLALNRRQPILAGSRRPLRPGAPRAAAPPCGAEIARDRRDRTLTVNTSRTARSRNSSGYFLGRGIAIEFLSPGPNPGFEASAKARTAQIERDRLELVADELNDGVAQECGCRLSLWRWETDAHPGLHVEGRRG